MDPSKVYPNHISEPIRIRVACDYIKGELRKYLSELTNKSTWNKIDKTINDHFITLGPRNFWNSFHGIAMGFKLKHHLTQVLTAENVTWEFVENFPITSGLASGAGFGYISYELENNATIIEIEKFFKDNSEDAEKWLNIFDELANSTAPRDHFPIIALEETHQGTTKHFIHDGNRRFIHAILKKKKSLSAYIGTYEHGENIPRNFWMPTSFLMDLVYNSKISDSYEEVLPLIKKFQKLSEAANHELNERVLIGKSEYRRKLKENLRDH